MQELKEVFRLIIELSITVLLSLWYLFLIVSFSILVVTIVALPVEHGEYYSAVAEVEQLREDLPKLSANSEDVIGQATAWNQRIKRKQRWNKLPLLGLLIPDGWEEMELIEISAE